MDLPFDRMQRAYGYLLLNDLNTFVYCCRNCFSEFETGLALEEHILYEHQDVKQGIESMIVSSDVFGAILDANPNDIEQHIINARSIKQEFETESEEFEPELSNSSSSGGIQCVFINECHDVLKYEAEDIEIVQSDEQMAIKNENFLTKKEKVTKKVQKLDPNKYYCDMCPREVNFIRKIDLTQHMRQNHMPTKIRNPCPICGETPRNLLDHMKVQHNGRKPYACNRCDRSFATGVTLDNHIRVHTGERPYLCSECGNGFKTSSSLTSHIQRIHQSEKSEKIHPYSCVDCHISFRLPSLYEQHRLQVHSDNRPHSCDICGRKFIQLKTLRNHKFTHAEPNFPCQHCGKKFKTLDYKRHHERIVHGEGKYSYVYVRKT